MGRVDRILCNGRSLADLMTYGACENDALAKLLRPPKREIRSSYQLLVSLSQWSTSRSVEYVEALVFRHTNVFRDSVVFEGSM